MAAALAAIDADELIDAFCRFEASGCGWQLWDAPVRPSPAFAPLVVPRVRSDDDGAKPTLASRALRWLAERLAGEERTTPISTEVDLQPAPAEPVPFHRNAEPVELRFALRAGVPVPAVAEHVVIACGAARDPVAFELFGTGRAVYVQFAVSPADAAGVAQQLAGHVPEIPARRQEGTLRRLWSGAGKDVVVDYGLANPFVRVLAGGQGGVEPLTAIVAALGQAEPGEVAVVQVVYEAVREPWVRAILDAARLAEIWGEGPDGREPVRRAKEKVRRPLYAAALRVAARSGDRERSWHLVRTVGAGLSAFADPLGNELVPLRSSNYPINEQVGDLIERQARRSGMLLNSEELAALVHVPAGLPALACETRPTKAAPPNLPTAVLAIGSNEHAGEQRQVMLAPDQRVRHTYVIGASGTGKSTLLQSMIVADMAAGDGVAVLDPHGDLADEVLGMVPRHRADDVVLFDPALEGYGLGFNVLAAHTDLEKTLLESDLVGVFRRLCTSWGDQMTSVLGNAVLAVLESPRGGTLGDLRRFLIERDFREEYLETVRDPEVVYYWRKQFPLLVGRPQAPVLTRLDALLRPKPVRRLVTRLDNQLDVGRVLRERKILIARLSMGAVGEENASLLGALLVAKLHQMAVARQAEHAAARTDFWVYIDEFHHVVTPSIAAILSGARKYRLGLTLAHQELRQIETRDGEVAAAVLANPCTRICFRLGDHDARRLGEGFSAFGAMDLQNLGTGEAVCRIDRADADFNLRTAPLAPVDEAAAAAMRGDIIERCRRMYSDGSPVEALPLSAARTTRAIAAAAQDGVFSDAVREPAATPAGGSTKRRQPAGRLAATRTITPAAARLCVGRGGAEHTYLQHFIKQYAQGLGLRAEAERQLADGGYVDVVIEGSGVSVACEISVTTPTQAEVANVLKCVRAGYARVFVVCGATAKRERIRQAVEGALAVDHTSRVAVGTAEELCAELRDQAAPAQAPSETVVRGYKLRRAHVELEPGEREARMRDISRIIAGSVRRLRGKNG